MSLVTLASRNDHIASDIGIIATNNCRILETKKHQL